MIHLEMSTMINRPITQVFEFVSTPENDFQWQYGTLATARLSEGINKKGTAFRSVGHLMGHRVQGVFEVIKYEPNREYGFRSLSGPLHSQTLYTFEITDDGTRITMSTWAHMVNFFQINERLLGKNIKRQLKENLTLLKELLEETVPRLRNSHLLAE